MGTLSVEKTLPFSFFVSLLHYDPSYLFTVQTPSIGQRLRREIFAGWGEKSSQLGT